MIDNNFQLSIIGQCLNAVVHGPFIPECEFQTLFGLTRNEVREISDRWPVIDEKSESIKIAVNNSINNLLGYPIEYPERWDEYISISRETLQDIYSQWRRQNNMTDGSYFYNLE